MLIKVTIKFSEYIFRHLKQKCQHKIRSKTGISLEITVNVFKCLIVSLVPLKFFLWQQHHFNFPQGQELLIQHHIHKRDLNLCLPLYYYGKAIIEFEKTQIGNFDCVYGARNLTK